MAAVAAHVREDPAVSWIDALDVPPMVRAWLGQMLDPEFLALMRAAPAERIDVRLAASRGRVRRKPVITLDGGPDQWDYPNPPMR